MGVIIFETAQNRVKAKTGSESSKLTELIEN